jgi:hypothetical protein
MYVAGWRKPYRNSKTTEQPAALRRHGAGYAMINKTVAVPDTGFNTVAPGFKWCPVCKRRFGADRSSIRDHIRSKTHQRNMGNPT